MADLAADEADQRVRDPTGAAGRFDKDIEEPRLAFTRFEFRITHSFAPVERDYLGRVVIEYELDDASLPVPEYVGFQRSSPSAPIRGAHALRMSDAVAPANEIDRKPG